MTFYGLLADYQQGKEGIYARTHAVLLVNCRPEPIMNTISYRIERPQKNKIETVPTKDLMKFLYDVIPPIAKGIIFDVYACEEYSEKYGSVLNELRHRFKIRSISCGFEKMPDKIIEHSNSLTRKANADGERYLDDLIKKISDGKIKR